MLSPVVLQEPARPPSVAGTNERSDDATVARRHSLAD